MKKFKLLLVLFLLPFFAITQEQEQVDYGTEYTITATPNEGWEFVNWTENGEVISTNPVFTFIVTADRNLIANFRRLNFMIQIDVNPVDAGTVEGAGVHPDGDIVVLHALPYDNYNFDSFTEELTGDVVRDNPYMFPAERDRVISANFVGSGGPVNNWIVFALLGFILLLLILGYVIRRNKMSS